MILITGATGTNGLEIAKQLAAKGKQVRALVRNPEKAAALKDHNVEIVIGDLDKPETLDTALEGVSSALLLPANTLQQLEQETSFIEAAKQAGTQHIVKFSALGADNVRSPARIARWHAQAEDLLEESGIAFTHLRPSTFMQNMFGFIPSIAAHGTFAMPMEDVKVGMVDIRDIAAVAVKALTEKGHEGKTFIITGPEALSYDDVAEKLSAAFGKKVTYVKVAQEEFKKGLVEVGTLEWYADALLELMKYVVIPQGSLVTNVVAEVAKKQPISFDQFAQDYAAMFKNN